MFGPSLTKNTFRISGSINSTSDCPPGESPVTVLQRELKMLEQEEKMIDNQIDQIRSYLKDFIERPELAAYCHHSKTIHKHIITRQSLNFLCSSHFQNNIIILSQINVL
jgi:hypothetical protein